MILPLSQSKRILHVSNIFQNSLIEVDEEGAKAVATIVATEGCKGVGSPSKGVRIPTSATVGHKGVRIPTGATRNPRKGVPIPTSATVGCK
ncbi:hypothetical protein A2U01_0061665, partial [Trifolium medium]|nr:hypothetical protein [Trifolium medium]